MLCNRLTNVAQTARKVIWILKREEQKLLRFNYGGLIISIAVNTACRVNI